MKILQNSNFLKIELGSKQYFLEITREEDHAVTKINDVKGNDFEYRGKLVIYPGSYLNLNVPEESNPYEKVIVYVQSKSVSAINRIFTYNAQFKTQCTLFSQEGNYLMSLKEDTEKEYLTIILQASLIFMGVK